MIGTSEKPFTIRFVGTESDVLLELTNATDHALKVVEVLTVFLKDEEINLFRTVKRFAL